MSDNVIEFPRSNKKNSAAQVEELVEQNLTTKYVHVQEAMYVLLPQIFDLMALKGFYADLDSSAQKDAAFLAQAVESYMCKVYNIEHPFQEIAEASFHDNNGILTYQHPLDKQEK